MTNEQLVVEAELKIQKILLQLERDWNGPPILVERVEVDTRNFTNLRCTIELRDGYRS